MDFDIDDSALQAATKALTVQFQRRLAREMLGAWMAGYAALDVVRQTSLPQDPDGDLTDALTLKTAFVPRRSLDTPRIDGVPSQRYQLDDLTRDDADDIRQVLAEAQRGDTDA